MKLYAISDLHLGHPVNRAALATIPAHEDDWLILAGDLCERKDHLAQAFETLSRRFAQLIWVPGNHELWSLPNQGDELKGEARYQDLVTLARAHGVTTPEDDYPLWTGDGPRCRIAPLLLLYDYSFRPADVPLERVLDWAAEADILCSDEALLHSEPHQSIAEWCDDRCRRTEQRLQLLPPNLPTILVNHYPLRQDLVRIPRIPRFAPWCGTTRTENWHRRFRALCVVGGHLHVRRTDWRDGVRFEEVSLGYPRQWDQTLGLAHYFREILPGPAELSAGVSEASSTAA